MQIKHCGHQVPPLQTYELFPEPSRHHLIMQVVCVYHCPVCQNVLYRWYGVRKHKLKSQQTQGFKTELHRISPQDFKATWQRRIEDDLIQDREVLQYKKVSLKVSQYSNTVHLPADRSISYLRNRLEPMTKKELFQRRRKVGG